MLPDELAEQIARLVENTLTGLSSDDARLHLLGTQLLQFLRSPAPPASTLQLMLANFSFRLSFAAEDQAAVRALLLELLNMVFQNMVALSLDVAAVLWVTDRVGVDVDGCPARRRPWSMRQRSR